MDGRRRHALTRFGAPVAFLAAVTVAVLLIKSALTGGSTTATRDAATATQVAARATVSGTRPTTGAARYYTIQAGDTLGSIAIRTKTTVDELLRLNPGIDPNSLHTGQRIRVG